MGFGLPTSVKKTLRRLMRAAGYDVVRAVESPAVTLLGLPHLPVRTVIDVGANTGQCARKALWAFPAARIVSFEPLPEPFEALRGWAAGTGGRVSAVNAALGDADGTVEFLVHCDHAASSSALPTTTLCETLYPFTRNQRLATVAQETLDGAVRRLGLSLEPDLVVKLDVQGCEDRVIRGGMETLGVARACICEVSLRPLYRGQATFATIHDLLGGLGLRYAGNLDQRHDEAGRAVSVDALFLREGADPAREPRP